MLFVLNFMDSAFHATVFSSLIIRAPVILPPIKPLSQIPKDILMTRTLSSESCHEAKITFYTFIISPFLEIREKALLVLGSFTLGAINLPKNGSQIEKEEHWDLMIFYTIRK